MGLAIISAEERLTKHSGIKGQVWGLYGVGKTSLLRTLDPARTLCIDLEAGLLSVQDWPGQSVPVRHWEDARAVACLLGGPNPAMPQEHPYSEAAHAYWSGRYGDTLALDRYDTVFIDSTSNATKYCLQWAQGQPEAFSERTGKPDLRGAYGLVGREMMAWVEQLHHISNLNVWLVGGLEEKTDDFNRRFWSPLTAGQKTANEIPYVFDEVLTLAILPTDEDPERRILVCHQGNQWGYPAKDRSGRLDLLEAPDLTALTAKIRGRKEKVFPITEKPCAGKEPSTPQTPQNLTTSALTAE